MSATKKRLWCIMKAHGWNNLSIAGIAMKAPDKGPQYFIPVFNTKKQALEWSQSGEHVRELTTVQEDPRKDGHSPSRNQGQGD